VAETTGLSKDEAKELLLTHGSVREAVVNFNSNTGNSK
jgi:hypothetical protein